MVVLTTAFTTKFPVKFVCHDKCDDPQASADVEQILLDREARNVTDDTNYCIMLPFKKFENNSCGMDDNQDPNEEIYCDATSEYKFSDFGMASSVITDNKAICMDSIKVYKAICDSFFMLGYFVGGILFGMIADRFGRKISVCLAIFVSFIGTGIGPLVNHHWAYAVFRIFPGAGSIACYLMAFFLAVEVVGREKLYGVPWSMTIFSFIGNMIAIPFALGEASNGILASFKTVSHLPQGEGEAFVRQVQGDPDSGKGGDWGNVANCINRYVLGLFLLNILCLGLFFYDFESFDLF